MLRSGVDPLNAGMRLLWLTPDLFRLRRVTLFRQSNQTISLHCPAPPSSGFPRSGIAPWARRKRAIHGPMRLSRHPCRSAHYAMPTLGLPKSQSVVSAKSASFDTAPSCSRTACRRQRPQGPRRQQAGQLKGGCRAFDLAFDLDARWSRHRQTRLGRRLNAGLAEWVEPHGCGERRAGHGWPVHAGPTERDRSEGSLTKSDPSQE